MCKFYFVSSKEPAKDRPFDSSFIVETVVGFIKVSFVVIIFLSVQTELLTNIIKPMNCTGYVTFVLNAGTFFNRGR